MPYTFDPSADEIGPKKRLMSDFFCGRNAKFGLNVRSGKRTEVLLNWRYDPEKDEIGALLGWKLGVNFGLGGLVVGWWPLPKGYRNF